MLTLPLSSPRRAASSTESILLVVGVAVALLIASTLLGRKLVQLDRNMTDSLDRGKPVGEGAVADLPDGVLGTGTSGAPQGGSRPSGTTNAATATPPSLPVGETGPSDSAFSQLKPKKQLKKKEGSTPFAPTGPVDTLGTDRKQVDPETGFVSDPDAQPTTFAGFLSPGDPPRPVERFTPSHLVKKLAESGAKTDDLLNVNEKADGSTVHLTIETFQRILKNRGEAFERIGIPAHRIPGLLVLTQTRGENIKMFDRRLGLPVFKVQDGTREVFLAVKVNPNGEIVDASVPTSITGTNPATGEAYDFQDPSLGFFETAVVKTGDGLIFVEKKTGEVVKEGVTFYVGEKAYPFVAGTAKGIGKGIYKLGDATIAVAVEVTNALADDVAYVALLAYAAKTGEYEYYDAYQPASTVSTIVKEGRVGEVLENTANVVFEGLVNLPSDAMALVADLRSGDPKRIERAMSRLAELGVDAVYFAVPAVNGIKHMKIKIKKRKLAKTSKTAKTDGPEVAKPKTDGPDGKKTDPQEVKPEPKAETKPEPKPETKPEPKTEGPDGGKKPAVTADDPVEFTVKSAKDAHPEHIIREAKVGDTSVNIKSGHGFNHGHTKDGVKKFFDPKKASMDDIESGIVRDIRNRLAQGEKFPQLGKEHGGPIDIPLEVKGVKLKYRIGMGKDGQLKISTYYPD